jgi:hypothetical protein
LFELLELSEKLVVFGVADEGLIEFVVRAIVFLYFLRQARHFIENLFAEFGHAQK